MPAPARRLSRPPLTRRSRTSEVTRSGAHRVAAGSYGRVSATAPVAQVSGTGTVFAPVLPSSPTLHVYVDWDGDGAFGVGDEITVKRVEWERGRSADFSTDATGSCTIVVNNVGATINAPGSFSPATNLNLVPGRAVLVTSDYGVTRAHFYGFIQRITPNAGAFETTLTCYDPLRRFKETDVVVAANTFVTRSCRDMRVAILDDFERGTRNLLLNPSFETGLVGNASNTQGPWQYSLVRMGRVADPCPEAGGSWAAEVDYDQGSLAVAADGTISQIVYMAPIVFAGTVYRFSVFLKSPAGKGSQTISIGIGEDAVPFTGVAKAVTVTEEWQRFSMTWTIPTTRTPSSNQAIRVFLKIPQWTRFLMDGASFTRGQALFDYADEGSGRWPNWCASGSFDSGGLNGWYSGWTNFVTNPSFEVDTAGWSVAADSFHAAGVSITRVNTTPPQHPQGGWVGNASTFANQGVHYTLAGTFKKGVTYLGTIYVQSGAANTVRAFLGSNGTPADSGAGDLTATGTGAYARVSVTWTPAADRTDVHFALLFIGNTGILIDAAAVVEYDSARSWNGNETVLAPPFCTHGVASYGVSDISRWGVKSQSWRSLPLAGSGRMYSFGHTAPYFVGGQPYTLSLWLRAVDAMPYRVGIMASTDVRTGTATPTFSDTATTTGTTAPGRWTQVTLTWTPSQDYTCDAGSGAFPFIVALFIEQTDAVGRSVLIDGVRVIPGTVADDFEMDHWVLAAEPDSYNTAAAISSDALSALSALNQRSMSRHYIRPRLTAPYYEYVVGDRADLRQKSPAEIMANDFSGFDEADVDRDAIINIVPVMSSDGLAYYSDPNSIARYGPQPGAQLGSSDVDLASAQDIGQAVLDRYSVPRGRPTMERTAKSKGRFASQLTRELDDLIVVTLDRLGIASKRYLIVKAGHKVDNGATTWVSTYGLEEHAYLETFPLTYVEEVLADNPVAFWKLDEPSGPFVDSAGSNIATATGAPTRNVVDPGLTNGRGIAFPTAGDYVTAPDAAALDLGDGPFTIEIRASRSVNTGSDETLLAKGSGGYYLGVLPSGKFVFSKGGFADLFTSIAAVPADGSVHTYTITRSGAGAGNTIIYVDGVAGTTSLGSDGTTLVDTATDLRIGGWTGGGNRWTGMAGSISVYKSVLPPTRVTAHVNALLA